MEIATTNEMMPAHLVSLVAEAAGYAKAAKSVGTQRAYATDWKRFTGWCADNGLSPLPADPRVVALYVTAMAKTHRPSSINRALAAMKHYHREAGVKFIKADPLIEHVWSGIRRTKKVRQQGADAILPEHLKAILSRVPETVMGKRDRALLLLGFSGAFRRSELVAVTVETMTLIPDEGMVVVIERSKTDQDGAGQEVAIPYGSDNETCPVSAVQEWLRVSGVTSGPLFRGVRDGVVSNTGLCDKMVGIIVQRYLGDDASGRFSAHSLRVGLITSAALGGVAAVDIQRTSRHKSLDMVAKYIRVADGFRNNAAKAVL